MNDRAVSVLENYELKVLRTYKGRSAIICETDKGLKILKEYVGTEERIGIIDGLLRQVRENSGFYLDCYEKNAEGGYLVKDRDQNTYLLKDYYEGIPCSPGEIEDIRKAFSHMGRLHHFMKSERSLEDVAWTENTEGRLENEIARKNRELRRIRTFVRKRSHKSEFENYLLQIFDKFFHPASSLEEALRKEDFSEYYRNVIMTGEFCHGDFQYHNVIFAKEGIAVTNFEKYQFDGVVRDFANFLRKVLEKNGWDGEITKICLDAYMSEYEMTKEEKNLLFYRMSYPEKFRKTVNCYMNSNKAVLSDKMLEKVKTIVQQEEGRQKCISFLDTFRYNN